MHKSVEKKSSVKVKVAGFCSRLREDDAVLRSGEGGEGKKKAASRERAGVAIQMTTSLKFDLPLEVNYEARSALC